MTDKIRFEVINPKGIEEWTNDYNISQVAKIYINDIEIVDILCEIESQYALAEGHPDLAGAYGHNTPKELFENLMEAGRVKVEGDEEGVELLCCSSCGISGCWTVLVYIKCDADYVYWYRFEHNHRDWKYNISYKFDKREYEAAVEDLKKTIRY